jgi:hypothetical protein
MTEEEIIKALTEGATPLSLDITLADIATLYKDKKITDKQVGELNLTSQEKSELLKIVETAPTGGFVDSDTTVDKNFVLPEDFKEDPTIFPGFKNFSPELQQQITKNVGTGKRYNLDGSTDKVLVGGQLVDAGKYDIAAEALDVFWSLGTQKRKEVFSTLAKHGMYFGSKPSPNYNIPSKDLEPLKILMLAANELGGNIDVALEYIKQTVPPVGLGGAAAVYSSREDRAETLESKLQSETGMVGDRQGFVDAASERIAQAERARGGSKGGEQAASLSSAASQQVEQKFSAETKAYSFAKYARLLNQIAGQ